MSALAGTGINAFKARLEREALLAASIALGARSDEEGTTSLKTYLILYNKCHRKCYQDNMQGARELAKYLAPIDLEIDCYLRCLDTSFKIPRLFLNYEYEQLIRAISDTFGSIENTDQKLKRWALVSRAVYFTSIDIASTQQERRDNEFQ